MKPPVKRNRIVNEFKAQILGGIAAPGSRLPTETELALHLNVARDTLRDALRILEDEHLIERIPGKGTFISSLKRSSDRVITFLLPCADIIADRIGYRTALITRELLCGAMIEASKRNVRIETIAVSPTNRNDDIQWSSLSHLNESSRGIVFTLWYRTLFKYLKKSGAKIALITLGSENRREGCRRDTDAWHHLHDDIPDVMRSADTFLRSEYDCKKTAAVLKNYRGESPESFDLFLEDPCPELFLSSPQEDEIYKRGLRRLWEQHGFDGLFLQTHYLHNFNYSQTLNQNFGLPESVRFLTYCETPYNARLMPHIPAINFDFRKMGAKAVAVLDNPDSVRVEDSIKSFIDLF